MYYYGGNWTQSFWTIVQRWTSRCLLPLIRVYFWHDSLSLPPPGNPQGSMSPFPELNERKMNMNCIWIPWTLVLYSCLWLYFLPFNNICCSIGCTTMTRCTTLKAFRLWSNDKQVEVIYWTKFNSQRDLTGTKNWIVSFEKMSIQFTYH